ncbi:ERCC4 domain-containing protein [Clostridium estertheticum]|uniref:ERCC4 domain-containing protein n=1 Tax=Clostridium estertheticum TaxID=238834 RepID=UPI001C0BFC8C|nr:ERCC4 domain-containing protein [Clostridium estertheticum]MBU3176068.1 ERCC4 domain-containing protein [Clostridium estertheticum]
MHYRFTDTEIKKLLKENFKILYDSREQQNTHILKYFDKAKVKYKKQKIDEGDYTAIISKCPEMGIYRDLYFKVAVERKNSIDELASNLGEETDTRDNIRLERELERAKHKGIMMFLIIEDKNGMENIKTHNYRSLYSPQAFIGKLTSIQVRYLNDTMFEDKKNTGCEILRKLKYAVRYLLKEGNLDIDPEE